MRKSWQAAAVLAIALAAAGCVSGTPDLDNPSTETTMSQSGQKQGSGAVRTDLAPLTKRWSALGSPVAAVWMSGTLSGQAPGPSTYWIDAVVELAPATASRLRQSATETEERPDLVRDVAVKVPSGDLLSSAGLDQAFAEGELRARAFLVNGTDTVVLEALGQ